MPHSKRKASGVLGGVLGLIGLSAVAGVLITATVTPAVAVTSAAATGAIDMFNNLPSVLQIDKLILPSKIYYTDDKGKNTLMATYYDQNRSPVTFKQVNTVMYDALLSSEDPRYYEHGGIDLIGTTRALISNIKGGSQTQGGSSISQQYVKNVQLNKCYWSATTDKELNACWLKASDSSGADGYERKLQEMRYAISLEQKYSKNDILVGYLNLANFGGTTYGIEAAAWHYFGVHAKDLNLSQASTLAGMVQNPNTYRIDMEGGSVTDSDGNGVNSKKDGYKLTKQRQTYVLDRMLKDGKITQKQHDETVKAPIEPHIKVAKNGCAAGSAAYFCAYVTAVLKQDPDIGADLLQKGGLKIYTTLDPAVQKAAQKAQDDWIPSYQDNMDLGSTSVSVEVSTGRVLAMAQNTDYVSSGKAKKGESSVVYAGSSKLGGSIGFNAGSTFKLFTLLDWLEQGKSVNQIVDGRKYNRTDWKDSCVDGGTVHVNDGDIPNYNKERGVFGTPMSFTKQSLNTGFMGMAQQLDLCDIGKVATRLGVTLGNGKPVGLATDGSDPDNPPLPAEIIGSDNVSPLAMAAAYATVANKGKYCEPKVIDKITDSSGKDVPVPDTTCEQVLDENVAATAAYALKGPLSQGGSGAQGNPNDGTELIGKTGTHNNLQTWLITSSTKVTTANWVGNADGGYHTTPDIFHRYYKYYQLSSLRYPLARQIQGAIDKIYKGGSFPQPDSSLTRQVLVNLPSVVGMSIDDATKTLTDAGFQVKVGKEVDSTVEKGKVAEQSPEAGKTAGGSLVTLSPSNGEGLEVPGVAGQAPAQAVASLRAAGFSNVTAACTQKDDGSGLVTGTSPGEGTAVSRDAAITVNYEADDCGGRPGDSGGPGNGNGRGN
ncbi:transglycosylase domain-containing protein [Microbacterium horticulturae]|uniref:Transglycosylase domain-containing protein n=1 Tax=Microbacterium horticulturae TaxID=3028316 RepID=A0ABY8C364_9MICO|nr:transglycosylase domain-containing protein [Microbacterium sp. KACC 23027]WEG09802.1 transglycosylase domain-containing protein [Microbacterium sp. KACC 23027]